MDIISYALSKKGMQQSVSDYLDEHLTNPTNPPLDTSLTIANAAADSKATGDKLSELKEDLSESVGDLKNAITSVEEIVYTTESLTNTDTQTGVETSTRRWAVWFDEDAFISRFKPRFSSETGTFKWAFITANEDFAKNNTVTIGEYTSQDIGTFINVNTELNSKKGILVYSDSGATIRYSGSDATVQETSARCLRLNPSNGIITELYVNVSHFAGTFETDLPADFITQSDIDEMGLQTDYLHGKQIMAIGDSMVRGHTVSTPWLTVLANRVGATPSNKGSNGAYMSNHLYNGSETSVYSKLCLPNSANYITDAGLTVCDYIIIFAGTNDCANDITIGDVDSNNPEEFCGAINAICQTLQTRVPTARICFITPYLRSGIETKCQTYINAIINVCKKYNIPVFDNSTNGGINFANTAMASALTLNDNTHLNEAGHAYVSYKYEAFLRTL